VTCPSGCQAFYATNRILPDLQCSLLCEDVRQEVTGNLILIGVVSIIRVPQVPITAARLLFFNRWTAGVGEFIQSLRLIAPTNPPCSPRTMSVRLADASGHAINVTVFGNITFRWPAFISWKCWSMT